MEIFLDENLSEHVADALNALNRGYFRGVHVQSTKRAVGPGATDEAILAHLASVDGILITQDKGKGMMRAKAQLYTGKRAGVIFLDMPKGSSSHWEKVKLLVKYWEQIVDACKTRKPPVSLRLGPRGLKPS